MPWRHTSPLDQKRPCIADDRRQTLSLLEVCALDGVSRNTGDTWIERDRTSGPSGLEARSRQPDSSPHQTPQPMVDACSALRCRPPSGGAQTRGSLLQNRHPSGPLPARSTVGAILRRQGLVPQPRPRRHLGPPGQPTTQLLAPNEVWSAEFQGHVTTGDGLDGDPLPVAAGSRRCLLGCQALSSTRGPEAKPVCPRVVQACGLPNRLRTDHGVPCAPTTLARLSRLAA